MIDESVIQGIKDAASFAPLHNPAHLIGIESCENIPQLKDKNVAVFDTAFHQTMPEESLPLRPALQPVQRARHPSLRRARHQPLLCNPGSGKNAEQTGRRTEHHHLPPGRRVRTVSAIRNGKCVDTSMGLTPLEGLVMGTRSGDMIRRSSSTCTTPWA